MPVIARKYQALARVRVPHDYYASGESPDFAFEPFGPTGRALDRLRLRFRAEEGGFRIFFPSDPDAGAGSDPLVPLGEVLDLYVAMRLRNRDFPLFTDLPGLSDGEVHLYRNVADGSPLAASGVTLAGDRFALEFATSGRTATIELLSAGGSVLRSERLPVMRSEPADARGTVRYVLDRGSLPPGLYALRYDRDEASETRHLFLGGRSGPPGAGPFALVHLRLDAADPAALAAGPPHEIPFRAREATWRYIVRLTNDRRRPEARIEGAEGTDVAFGDPEVLSGTPQDQELVLRYTSAAPVPYRERPRSLRLVAPLPGRPREQEIAAPLPNPAPWQAVPDVFLYL